MKKQNGGVQQGVEPSSAAGHEFAANLANRQASSSASVLADAPVLDGCTMAEIMDAPYAQEQLAATGQRGADDTDAQVSHTDAEIVRIEQIGTLFRFFNYLHKMKVLSGDDTLDRSEVQRALQRYAYIAKKLGTDMKYEFGFLDSGAFSTDIAMDIYYRGCAAGGTEPFAHDRDASQVFLRMVRGRSIEWLNVATFALRENHGNETLAEFVKRMKRENSEYSEKLVTGVFNHVRACQNVKVVEQT